LPQGFLKKIKLKLLLADLAFKFMDPLLGRSHVGSHRHRL
jgi:hypothetical protein